MRVTFYATLRTVVGQRHVLMPEAVGMTVWQMLNALIDTYPALRPQLLDDNGVLWRHVHVMVNGRDAQYLAQGLDTCLEETAAIDIFPPVGGGVDL